jgi:membrane protease YdiL (CAAX protease family)
MPRTINSLETSMSLTSETETSPAASQCLLGVFLRFLRQPVYSERPDPSWSKRAILSDIFRLYSLKISVLIPITLVISVVRGYLGASEDPISEFMEKTPLLLLGLAVVVVAPLLEELIFRLPLRFSALNISLPLAFVVLFINVGHAELQFVLAVAVGLLVRYLLHHRVDRVTGHAFYANYIGWLFYGSTLLFGALHIFNFDAKTYFVAPLIVMPQITAGIFLAFIRLRYGFWWSVLTHGFHNFCLLFPLVLLTLGSEGLQAHLSHPMKTTLTTTDYALLAVVLIFVGGGLFLCLKSVMQMIREWRLESRDAKLSLDV